MGENLIHCSAMSDDAGGRVNMS